MQAITIRHCEPSDIAQIHALYTDPVAFADTLQLPFQAIAHWEKRLDPAPEGHTCLVAVCGVEVVGQLGLEVFRPAGRRHAATLGIGVKASARQLGVGSALLAAAIDLCENWMNIFRMEIEVYTDNAAAIALYTKHGFIVEGTCSQYAFRNGRYVDVHIMARLGAGQSVNGPGNQVNSKCVAPC